MLPEKVAEVRDWLGHALHDLRSAEHLYAAEPPLIHSALFHCQQAAEKALKGYLTWHDREFRRTHDLDELVAVCMEEHRDFAALANAATTLTPYAVGFRYPRGGLGPTAEETEEALRIAHEVFSFVLDRLPPEVRPPT